MVGIVIVVFVIGVALRQDCRRCGKVMVRRCRKGDATMALNMVHATATFVLCSSTLILPTC